MVAGLVVAADPQLRGADDPRPLRRNHTFAELAVGFRVPDSLRGGRDCLGASVGRFLNAVCSELFVLRHAKWRPGAQNGGS